MDPYRESAEPSKKLIVKTWKVDISAFMFALVLIGAVVGSAIALYQTFTPRPCVETVKIIASDNDDRHCGRDGHFILERMGDSQRVLVHCVCGESDAGAR